MHNRTVITATALVLSVCVTSPSLAIDALLKSAPGPLVLNQDPMHESMHWQPEMVLDFNGDGNDDREIAIPTDVRMYQPPPIKHIVGNDNRRGLELHHPGEECINCHTMWPMTVIHTPQK